MIFTQKQKKYFKHSLYYIIIYIISLHPVSGGLGGIVFLLTGWAIPTITNFLLAYFLLLFFPEKLSKLLKLFIFILLSFILGVNIKIPYIFTIFHSYAIPEINSIKIIHPLSSSREPAYFRSGKLEYKVDSPIKLKTSFFGSSFEVEGDEGCMCMYFKEPYTPLTGGNNFVGDSRWGIFDKLGSIGANSINYRFDQIIPSNNGIVVYTTIKDVKGGHIIVQSTFPKGLGYSDTFDHGVYVELMSALRGEDPTELGKLYVALKDNHIEYKVKDYNGIVYKGTIDANELKDQPKKNTLKEFNRIKPLILRITTNRGHTTISNFHWMEDHFKKYFWRYMFFNLINNNIWQICLSLLEKTKVSDPLESLLKLKKETYISPILAPPIV